MTVTHGYSLYTKGCRCDICRQGNTDRQKTWREARRSSGDSRRNFIRQFHEPDFADYDPAGDWKQAAACRGSSDWLLPEKVVKRVGRPPRNEHPTVVYAIAACLNCPVLEPCRTWVISHSVDPCPWHVVAAMTPHDRHRTRRELGMTVLGRRPNEGAA